MRECSCLDSPEPSTVLGTALGSVLWANERWGARKACNWLRSHLGGFGWIARVLGLFPCFPPLHTLAYPVGVRY